MRGHANSFIHACSVSCSHPFIHTGILFLSVSDVWQLQSGRAAAVSRLSELAGGRVAGVPRFSPTHRLDLGPLPT